jgi:hypothetical protein
VVSARALETLRHAIGDWQVGRMRILIIGAGAAGVTQSA